MAEKVTSLEGAVELINGRLTLLIPLAEGGDQFVACTRTIAHLDGDYLNIIIPEWLAKNVGMSEGSRVVIDNRDGTFNLSLV